METLVVIAILLVTGYAVGSYNEKRHYQSIREREVLLADKVLVFSDQALPELVGRPDFRLIAGSTVVSIDYFKKFAAGIHSFFGGRLTSYESLLDRARRESLLRMREKALESGATMIFGVRFETSSINNGDPRFSTGIELIAYGTAIVPDKAALVAA